MDSNEARLKPWTTYPGFKRGTGEINPRMESRIEHIPLDTDRDENKNSERNETTEGYG